MTDDDGRGGNATRAQRLRVKFRRGPQAAQLGHLDLTRIWERAFRDAGVAVSYSQGNRPQPRLTLAAGLPTGVTSDGELLDVVVAKVVQPTDLCARLNDGLLDGLQVLDCCEVGMGLPSLPSAVRWADYVVELALSDGIEVEHAVSSFLKLPSLPWEDTRGERTRHYDLRPLVGDLNLAGNHDGSILLEMRLRCEAGAVGRADQVVKALGLPRPTRVHRRRLVLVEASPARAAWRRQGQYR